MTARFYRPELDALRFFAFFAVFLCHSLTFSYRIISYVGFALSFGVQIFFLLSAYLIGELLRREKENTGTVHVFAFYLRRILRIWPLYFGVLFGVYFIGLIWKPMHLPSGVLPTFSFLAGNWYSHRFGYTSNPINHLWTISIEEQFYLCIPALILYFDWRSVLRICALLIVVAYAAIGIEALIGSGEWQLTTDSFVQFQFFAMGLVVALTLRGWVPKYSGIL